MVQCRLLECMALSCVPLTDAQRAKLLGIADDNMRHPSSAIQAASTAALHAFSRAYLTGSLNGISHPLCSWNVNLAVELHFSLITHGGVVSAVSEGSIIALGQGFLGALVCSHCSVWQNKAILA